MLLIYLISVLQIFLFLNTTEVAGDEPENVLILLADDAGFESGAYLNRFCQTPNIDALAARGLIFNNAFTTVSSCSPSRAQLLTGMPSHQSGMYGLHQGVHNFNVLPNVKSLPNVLREKSNKRILSGIIGKKHVGAQENFRFDYEQTEEHHSINQIGRNITNIKRFAKEFLTQAKNEKRPFFLLVAFHDPHRCGHITPEYGEFCERWGSGEIGMGTIPDWKPIYYDWRNLEVPDYLPNTDAVRQELAAQYMTISRLDQGIGLVLQEVEALGFTNNTLVVNTSDNGPPFPGGRTNLYESGIREPLIVFSPAEKARKKQTTAAMSTLLDIYPTVLNVFQLEAENSTKNRYSKSLLPILMAEPFPRDDDAVYASQNYHEVTMDYPMRMIRTRRLKLIHNLNYWAYFPIDQDVYTSLTFQQILNATISHSSLAWYRNLGLYYKRPEWQLYDIKSDPLERYNLIDKDKYRYDVMKLKQSLNKWQSETNDPWICAPHGVLQSQGIYKDNPLCLTLAHEYVDSTLSNYLQYDIV